MKIYLAGPMSGYPEFNFPVFRRYAKMLRDFGHFVFSPAERDEIAYGKELFSNNSTGDAVKAAEQGFNIREALAVDLDWICREADAIALMPGWGVSAGVKAELATAEALGLQIMLLPPIAGDAYATLH